ncbi:MAG: IS110 family transposase, partial [candidate division Zixibacteria bacterium]|nr:IS110 family transposase [candidate division Zixibacteria bacterium]
DIINNACKHNKTHYKLLQTISGCGPITALTVLYETHTIGRFASMQCYSSYSRVIRAENSSSGKDYGRTSNDKIGNPYLKWALSEIGSHIILHSDLVRQWYDKQVTEHGKGSAMARLRHKLAVAIYQMLKNNVGFDEYKFLGIQKEQETIPAHNWQEKSGKSSKPHCVIGKSPVSSLPKRNRKMITGRLSLRTTGKCKVRTKCRSTIG